MELIIQDPEESVNDIMEKIGYVPLDFHRSDDFGMVRKIGKKDFPRFHLYVKMLNGGDYGYKFTLGLEKSARAGDKKKKDKLIEKEMARIKERLMESWRKFPK